MKIISKIKNIFRKKSYLAAAYVPTAAGLYGENGTSWIPMATAAYGTALSSVPPGVGAYGYNSANNAWYPLAVDASGNSVISGIATPTTIYYLDGNRTDSYAENGSLEFPFKTLSTLASGVSGVTGPFAIVSAPTPSAYTYTGNISFPAYFMTILGNGSSWSVTGNITTNGAFYITNLRTTATGTLTYAATTTTESVRIGGSLTITGGIFTSGYEHFFDLSILSNTLVTLNPGATPVFTNVVGTPRWKSASGATAATVLTIINSTSLASGAYTAVDMSNGGLFTARGFAAVNNGTVVNINLVGSSATGVTAPNILNGVQAAWTTAGSSFTTVDGTDYLPLLTGTSLNFLSPMQVAQYSLTGQTASLSSTTIYTTLAPGVYRITLSVALTTVGSAGTVFGSITNNGNTASVAINGSGNPIETRTSMWYRSASSAIAVQSTVSGNTGGVYRVDAIVERVS